jgi:hypothetical protein
MNTHSLAFDKSLRSIDADGHMRVEESRISKANVCPYRGSEIPGWERLGLSADRIYHLLRDPKELQKAADSFSGKPLLVRHVAVSADLPQKDLWVGTVGTVTWEEPYLVARPLMVLTKEAIELVQSGEQRELSAAYRYEADMTPGTYGGQAYDGRMVNIRGNHVAIVSEGRAGPDVHVADELPQELKAMKHPALFEALKKANLLAADADPMAFDAVLGETPAVAVVKLSKDEMKAAEDEALAEKRKEHGEDAELDEEEREKAYERARDKKAKDKKAKDSKHAKDGDVDHRKDFDSHAKDELRAEIKAELTKQFREAAEAREAVKPLVGVVSIAMDSAEEIYRFALERVGNKRAKTAHVDALPDMIASALEAKQAKPRVSHAMDSSVTPVDFDAIFRPKAA